jgi:stearoyl-CoA desaturase (delta-9 desaturase)
MKNMQLGSTSRNINLLSLGVTVTVLLGLFNTSMFTTTNIIVTVISFYIFNILGNWMTLHRYYSHNSFEFKNNILKWFFTLLAVLSGRGSPLGWVYLHRKHHAYSDTEKDPHSPKFLGYKIFGFGHYRNQEEEPMQLFMVKDLMTKEQLFIHKWYMVIVLLIVTLLACVNIETLYFVWILPIFLVQLSQNNFNYFGHMTGYRNFVTRDNSKNNLWLFPLILGEAWHNNHHNDPKNMSTTVKKFEIDPIHWFILLIKK